MKEEKSIYLDTNVQQLEEDGVIDRTVLKACLAAKPPMLTAGDIVEHFRKRGNFADVPGCRRPGRVSENLIRIVDSVVDSNTPSDMKPVLMQRRLAGQLKEEASFDFLTPFQRNDVLRFKEEHGHLPMFRLLMYYLTREGATRNDTIMSYTLGLNPSRIHCHSLSDVCKYVDLSRERVRQIIQTYVFPEELMLPRLWTNFADHSTYYADHTSEGYVKASTLDFVGLKFATYADVISRSTMLKNIEGKYLARRGWEKEIEAWLKRLEKLMGMPRSVDSRISIEGLAMGGSLDTRISLIVMHQIAPSLGIKTDAPDGLILAKNIVD